MMWHMSEAAQLIIPDIRIPAEGSAVFAGHIFEAATMSDAETEISNHKVWGAFANGALRSTYVETILEKLPEDSAPAMRSCVKLLRGVAAAHDEKLNHVVLETKTKPDFTPHRDGINYHALSFLIVTSGFIKYRFGGFYFAKKHYRYQEAEASTGDVLVLNNLIKYPKRPVHSGAEATGKRIILDFTYPPIWTDMTTVTRT